MIQKTCLVRKKWSIKLSVQKSRVKSTVLVELFMNDNTSRSSEQTLNKALYAMSTVTWKINKLYNKSVPHTDSHFPATFDASHLNDRYPSIAQWGRKRLLFWCDFVQAGRPGPPKLSKAGLSIISLLHRLLLRAWLCDGPKAWLMSAWT